MNVGEFNSYITIAQNRYSEFKVIFVNSLGSRFTVSNASSETLVTSGWCSSSTEEKFLFVAAGLPSAFLSANNLSSILESTPDDYEIEFVNNAPGIPQSTGSVVVEDAWLEDLTTSSVGLGTKITGILFLTDVPPTPCSSSSSSSSY